jgi:hypothetical protein
LLRTCFETLWSRHVPRLGLGDTEIAGAKQLVSKPVLRIRIRDPVLFWPPGSGTRDYQLKILKLYVSWLRLFVPFPKKMILNFVKFMAKHVKP